VQNYVTLTHYSVDVKKRTSFCVKGTYAVGATTLHAVYKIVHEIKKKETIKRKYKSNSRIRMEY